MKRVALLIVTSLMSAGAIASEAICRIEIEDVHAGTEYTVVHEILDMSEVAPDLMEFKLPGSDIECASAFFNLNTGTVLTCWLDSAHFVQSDRSTIEEKNAKNHLSFVHGSAFFGVKIACAEPAER